jgi:sugar lactone lactonase YvrE
MNQLLRTRRSLAVVAYTLLAACGAPDSEEPPPAVVEGADSAVTSIADVGFMTPESVLHDETADVYFVTNINGGPLDKDNNGFVSRVSPDGNVLALQWVAGGQNGVTLHAPKGMALKGDSLFVADIDTVRIFHRDSGASLGARGVPGANLLNDMATGPDGTVYVTDTGFRAGAGGALDPSGTDAVYRFGASGQAEAVLRDTLLHNPNGIAVSEEGIVVVPFGGTDVILLGAAGERTAVATAPSGQLDGVVRLDDGTLFVTGWEGSAVYRIAPGGAVTEEVVNIDAPADLGYDATRRRLLIPTFNRNTVEIRTIQ